jgi:hypothetical protein
MNSTHQLWVTIYGASGIAAYMNSAATGLTANQRARMAGLVTYGTTNSMTTPSQDSDLLYCLATVMNIASKST